nr:hypothetical protein [Tanacetum cinerariifolium]
MILKSVENGPLIWPSNKENEVTRPKKYSELSAIEAIQADCDVKATNIILQGLPPEVYALVSNHKVAMELWERIQLLMQGNSLTKQERECKIYDEFDKFAYKKGETLLHHNVYSPSSSIPQVEYASSVNQQAEFSKPDSGLIVLVFQKGNDLINAINHMMSFLTTVVTSRYPTTNNQLRNSSNPRQQATINNERVTLQPIQGRQKFLAAGSLRTYTSGTSGNNSGKQMTVICYNCKGEGHMSKQCTKPKRKRDDSCFKDKVLLVQAEANGQILHEDVGLYYVLILFSYPTTTEQRLARKNELKARGTLLMALPDKHQLKFNSHKDAKTLMEAIEKRFGGNTETKKKLISQLEILGVSLSQEDINLKFLRSLPSEWMTHTLIWRNKSDLEDQSLDDLFNSLKIYKAKVKSSSFASTSTQNIAFVSSFNTDNTNEPVSAALSVSAICAKMHVSSLPNVDSLSNAIDADDLEEMDLKWQIDMLTVECYNCHKKGHFTRECRSPKDTRRNGVVEPQKKSVPSFQAEEEPTNYALMAFSSLSSSSKNEVSDLEDESKTKTPQNVPSFVQSTEQVKSSRPSIQHVETSIPAATPKPASPKPTSNGKYRNRKACFVCKILDHLIKDYDYHEKKMAQPTARNHAHRGNHKHYAQMKHSNPQRHMVPVIVLTQSKPIPINVVPINAVRPVSTAVPKFKVTKPRHDKPIVTKPNSPTRRHINHSPSPKASNSPPRVTVVQALVSNPQHALKDKRVIDSGSSRHMTGNMSYLSDFEELNGGYVAFSGNPKGGKISGKRSDNGTEFKNHDLNQFCGMKGIKREFSVPRTLQQNGVAERKNKTLVEAARTMLEDLLLPIPFWAEAVNTACYVDEGFLVGYSVSSKAFRVFNSRTWIVQETLHMNFLENKPNVASSGPIWLFDIDTLTKTMNYQPVTAGNQSNPSAGFQNNFDAEKQGRKLNNNMCFFLCGLLVLQILITLIEMLPLIKKEPEFNEKKPKSEVNVSPSSSAQSKKHDNKTKREAKGKSLVESYTRFRNLSADFEDFSENRINEFNVAEADFNNLETPITVSPIPTTRVHKDHPVTQIIEEPNRVHQALKDPSWIEAMQEELLQFKMQKV